MRFPFLAKAFSLFVVGIITVAVTNSVVAQKPKQKQQTKKPAKNDSGTVISKGPLFRPVRPRRLQSEFLPPATPGTTQGVSKIFQTATEVRPEGIYVASRAGIRINTNVSHLVWWTKVVKMDRNAKPGREEVYRKVYSDQLFANQIGVDIYPTFKDIVKLQLPPGKYGMIVGISRVDPILGPGVTLEKEHRNLIETTKLATFSIADPAQEQIDLKPARSN